jgi:hypothetical protein
MADPNFIELYKSYLATFNTFDIDATLSYLSPRCTAKIFHLPDLHPTREDMRGSYLKDFASRSTPVTLREIKEITRSGDGVVGTKGVWVELLDADNKRLLSINYWYDRDDDGVWRHVLHEILLVTDFDNGKSSQPAMNV